MPRFSIIVPHYDGAITDELFIEGMDSIESQTFKDFEVLIYHDGPLSRPLPDLSKYTFDYKFRETKTRYNDWGHSLRDLGIKEATGEYILHFNPDNILFPDALEYVDYKIDIKKNGFNIPPEIVIGSLILEGVVCQSGIDRVGGVLQRTFNKDHLYILPGNPPVQDNVDCMQVIISKKLWLSIGGWYDKSERSDGLIYHKVCKDNFWVHTGRIIGVHR